ncbi:MAG: hypothetical protein LAO76_24740 [Acidobacteriia bacterium]|nr:hypothetical protein [Terriglobia bacterium]
MMTARHLATFLVAILCASQARGQATGQTPPSQEPSSATAPANPWEFNLSVSGYIVPDGQSYVQPTFMGDRGKLHAEARYNYESPRTGSLWVGYNLSVGKKVVLEATPMIGGIFGDVNGVAPGLQFTVTRNKVELYSTNEYVFDAATKAGNFFYTWTQLTYSPVKWFKGGYVVQRTHAYQTPLSVQRGLLAEFTHKKMQFATDVFDLGEASPTVVLTMGYSF